MRIARTPMDDKNMLPLSNPHRPLINHHHPRSLLFNMSPTMHISTLYAERWLTLCPHLPTLTFASLVDACRQKTCRWTILCLSSLSTLSGATTHSLPVVTPCVSPSLSLTISFDCFRSTPTHFMLDTSTRGWHPIRRVLYVDLRYSRRKQILWRPYSRQRTLVISSELSSVLWVDVDQCQIPERQDDRTL